MNNDCFRNILSYCSQKDLVFTWQGVNKELRELANSPVFWPWEYEHFSPLYVVSIAFGLCTMRGQGDKTFQFTVSWTDYAYAIRRELYQYVYLGKNGVLKFIYFCQPVFEYRPIYGPFELLPTDWLKCFVLRMHRTFGDNTQLSAAIRYKLVLPLYLQLEKLVPLNIKPAMSWDSERRREIAVCLAVTSQMKPYGFSLISKNQEYLDWKLVYCPIMNFLASLKF
jgi:hypothetical protein